MQKMLILSKNDIKHLVDIKELIEVMKDAYALLSANDVIVPERLNIEAKKYNATALFMPSYTDKIGKFGFKFVCVSSDNAKKNLPLIHSFATLIDAEYGKLLVLADGSSITAYRTGAGSGAAIDIFAKKC